MKLSEYLKQNGMTTKDYFEMRKRKEKGKTTLSDYRREQFNSFKSRYESLGNEMTSLYNDYQSRFFDDKGTAKVGYKDNSKGAYNDYLSKKEYLEAEMSELVSFLENNKTSFDEEGYKAMQEYLNSSKDSLGKILTAYKSDSDYYSKFKNEYEYNDAVKVGELYDMSSADILPYLDPSKTKKEKEALVSRQKELEKQLSELGASGNKGVGAQKKLSLTKELNDVKKQIRNLEESPIAYTTSSGQNITWKNLYNAKKYEEDFNALYDKYSSNKDWDTDSKFVSKAKTKGRKNIEDYGEDLLLEYIHGDREFQSELTYARYGDATAKNYGYDAGSKDIYDYGKDGFDSLNEKEKQLITYLRQNNLIDEYDEAMLLMGDNLIDRHNNTDLQRIYEIAQEYPISGSLFSLGYTLNSIPEYIFDSAMYLTGQTDELDTNHYANLSSTIRQGVADKVDWEVGEWDAFDFLYNTGMSMADSVVSNALFGKFGGVALGLSAAASSTNDALNRGMSKGQAFMSGVASGIFEGVFETWSIGAFGGLTKNLKRADFRNLAKYVGKNMWNNAKEETLTEIANIIYDTTMNGDFSQTETAIRQYMASGMSESDAKKKVAAELGIQVVEAAGSGALMGLGFGAGGSVGAVSNTIQNGKLIKDAGQTRNLVNLGKSLGEGTESYKFADKITDKSKAFAIGQLYGIEAEDIANANKGDIVKSLERKGYNTDVANHVANMLLDSKNTTFDDSRAEKTYNDIINNPNSTVSQRGEAYRGIREGVDNYGLQKLVRDAVKNKAKSTNAEVSADDQSEISTQTEKAVESKFESNTEGKDFDTKSGRIIESKKLVSSEKDNMAFEVTYDDDTTETVDANDISFGNDGEALVYSAVMDMNVPVGVAETLIKGYKGNDIKSAGTYVNGVREAFTFGKYNQEADLNNGEYASQLTEEQRNNAFKLGKIYANEKAIEGTKAIVGEAKPNAIKKREGKLHFEGDKLSLTSVQNVSIENLKVLTVAIGKDIHIFESYVDENGKRVYKDAEGNIKSAPNGFYQQLDGSIWIDLNAGNSGQGIMMYTVAHELTHFIKQWSPTKFKALADFLVEQYGKEGVSVHQLVLAQQKKAKDNGREISYDVAFEEMVADSMEAMLTDGKVIRELAHKDKGLFNKIKSWIDNLLRKLNKEYKNYSPESNEGQMLSEMKKTFEEAQRLFADALVDASDNYFNSSVRAEKNTTSNDDVKESQRLGGYFPEINVSTKDISIFGIKDINDIKEVKQKVYNYLLGKYVSNDKISKPIKNIDTDMDIYVYWGGIDETFGNTNAYKNLYTKKKKIKLATMTSLAKLIKYGEVRSPESPNSYNSKSKNTYAYLTAPITVDGVEYTVNMDIKKTQNGNRFYVHTIKIADESPKSNNSSTKSTNSSAKNSIPQTSKKSQEKHSDRDEIPTDTATQINQSMTMEEAKTMIQKSFVSADIKDFYDDAYKNGDEWIKGEGIDEVAMYIENEYSLQAKYLDKIPAYLNGDITVEEILQAYLDGTLVGKAKPKANRLDTSKNYRINDTRFYSPKHIDNIKELFEIAGQKLTVKNRAEVSSARAKILLFAHNEGASELLGLTKAELNKKLRSWSGYTAGAKDISQKINKGVADSNKWTGIENCSWLVKSQVSTEELESLVKEIKGTSSQHERNYITRTMLALDTHIDWTELTFDFKRGYADENRKTVRGLYNNRERTITVGGPSGMNTVAHEMGHALDYKWQRDLFGEQRDTQPLTENSYILDLIQDEEGKQFYKNFRIFIDSLTDVNDNRSSYTMDTSEVFARFVARFVEWVEITAGGRNFREADYYNDKFTGSQYVEFVKLLQEKAMLDAKKMATETSENGIIPQFVERVNALHSEKADTTLNSDRDSEGNTLTKEQQEFFKDSKVRDEDGNLRVMYHGTPNGDFNTFKISDGAHNSLMAQYGAGYYFDSNKDSAQRYTKDVNKSVAKRNPKVFEAYLNIKNPLIIHDEHLNGREPVITKQQFMDVVSKGNYEWMFTNGMPFELTKYLGKSKTEIQQLPREEIIQHWVDMVYDRAYFDSDILSAMVKAYKGDSILGVMKDVFGNDGVKVVDKYGEMWVAWDNSQIKEITNTNPTSDPDIRYSSRIEADMSEEERYEILKDKKIQPQEIEIDKDFDIEFSFLENNIKSIVEKPLISKLQELGYLKKYTSNAIDVEFEFTGSGVRKSIHSQENHYGGNLGDFAKVVLNMQKLLDNSVLLEIHADKGKGTPRENPQLIQTYVLLSAFREGNSIKPVQFEVKQYVDNDNRLYLAVALTKIETGVKGNTIPQNEASTSLLPVSKISIADLFKNVNIKDAKFLKYAPNQFLSEEQIKAKERELAIDRAKYSIKESSRVTNTELASMDDTALYIKNTKKANYIGMIFNGTKTEETRSRRTLDAFIGKDFYVTDGEKVYGKIVLGEPHKYTEEEFHKLENQKKHRVPKGDEYDVKPGGTKWAYPIESYKKFDKPKKLSDSKEYMNSFQARQVLYSERDYVETDSKAAMTTERIDYLIEDSGAGSRVDYANYWITSINPTDFINMTTTKKTQDRDFFDKWGSEWNPESNMLTYDYMGELKKNMRQTPYLAIDINTGEVVGHEGRHRMRALEQRGIASAEIRVEFRDEDGRIVKYSEDGSRLETKDVMEIINQFGTKQTATIKNIIPLNKDHRAEILENYGENIAQESDIKYSERDTDSVSTRSLLANALEGAAQNDIEKNKLAQYKEKIALIEAEQKKLHELREKLFTKGIKGDERRKIQEEATRTANRINTYDRQLFNLESTTALKNVLTREKELARKRQKQKDNENLRAYKEKVAKTTRELLKKNRESRERAIEGRTKTEMRHKVKKVVNDLNNLLLKPTKERHVPEEMRIAVAEALALVNMDTVDADTRVARLNEKIANANDPDIIASLIESRDRILNQGNKLGEKLTKLKDAYGMIRDSADDSLKSRYDDVIYSKIESVQKKVGKTPLRSMTLEQLESVYELYEMVLTTVRDSNKAFAEDLKMTRQALGSNTFAEIKENNKARDRIRFEGIENFGWKYLKPMMAMKTIGSGILQKLWNNILYGQEVFAQDYDEAVKFAKEMKEKYGYKKWNLNKLYSFESKSGKVMKINLEQMMSIYAYSKRKQADEHIEFGGVLLNESIIKVKNKLGKIVEVKVNDSTAYRLDKLQVGEIINTLEKEFPGAKDFVDEMQKYLSETMGEKGNEVSMKMYGIKLFKEEHYFPLKSSKDFMEAANAKLKGDVKIKNKGMTKSTVEHANNPIVLEGFLDVWGNHVNEMAMYHGLVLPLEDFSRTLNYGFKADDNLNADAESVRTALRSAFGESADNYLNELLKAINGGVLHDSSSEIADKMISRFKKAKVMASLSVIIQQPTAIIRAMGIIEPKYFTSQNFHHKQTWEELKKYCPTAIIKETGSFDTNMGRTIVDMVKEDRKFTEKVGDALGKAPAWMDEMGWNMIWRALKKKVATEQNLSGEALLKECGRQMTLIINETQVYDSVMSRNELMRSKSALTKMATAFMGEPTTVANMIYGAALDFKRGNKGTASKTVAAVVSSVVINGLVSSLVYAFRDDDEEKTWLEKYLTSATTEVIDGLNPLTYIPFVKDAYSLAQGYDVERTDMSLIGDVYDALEDFYNVLDPEAYEDMSSEEISKHVYENSIPLLTSICDMFGLPVGNILRDAEAIIVNDNLSMSKTSGEGSGLAVKEGWLNSSPKIVQEFVDDEKYHKLYLIANNGDAVYVKSEVAEMVAEKVASGTTEKEAKQSVKSSFTSVYREEYKKAYKNRDAEEMNRIRKFLYATGLWNSLSELDSLLAKWREDA